MTAEEALIAAGQRAEVAFDSYLYVGDHVGDVALVYDWCYDLLTPAQRTRWRTYANQAVWNVWHPSAAQWGGVSYPWSGWSTDNPSNNYYYSFLRATMLLGIAEHGEDPAGAEWVTMFRDTKIGNQLVPVFAQDLVGGGSREGTGYGTSHRALFTLYDWWEQTTGEPIHGLTTHARLSMADFLHLMVPTLQWLAPIGDHARESTGALFDYHRHYVEVLTSLYRNDPMAPYGRWFLNHCPLPEMGSAFNYVFDFLYDDPAIPEAPLAGLTKAYHAPGIGRVYARSSWDPDATWINLMAGPYTESHAHQDQGSLMLYRNEWLADDQNRRSRSGIRQELTMHNLTRIDQGGSPVPMVFDAASVLVALDHEPTHTYTAVDVTPMYAGPTRRQPSGAGGALPAPIHRGGVRPCRGGEQHGPRVAAQLTRGPHPRWVRWRRSRERRARSPCGASFPPRPPSRSSTGPPPTPTWWAAAFASMPPTRATAACRASFTCCRWTAPSREPSRTTTARSVA